MLYLQNERKVRDGFWGPSSPFLLQKDTAVRAHQRGYATAIPHEREQVE